MDIKIKIYDNVKGEYLDYSEIDIVNERIIGAYIKDAKDPTMSRRRLLNDGSISLEIVVDEYDELSELIEKARKFDEIVGWKRQFTGMYMLDGILNQLEKLDKICRK